MPSRAANAQAVPLSRSVDFDALLEEKACYHQPTVWQVGNATGSRRGLGRSEATGGSTEAAVPFWQIIEELVVYVAATAGGALAVAAEAEAEPQAQQMRWAGVGDGAAGGWRRGKGGRAAAGADAGATFDVSCIGPAVARRPTKCWASWVGVPMR